MLKNEDLIGAIIIYRTEVRPFTDKQIDLVKNFAAQAVIAIENARLLNELRESLEQQTATAEVLKVISGSPGDLAPVFESLLANAKRLCDAKFGTLLLREGSALRCVAIHGATAEYTEARQRAPVIEPAPDTALGRVLKTERVVQIADIQKVPGYVANPVQAPIVQLAGARSILSVPMLKEKKLVGVVEIYRQEVQPFTDKQIALLQNFAAQAVIAIENARLLNELRQRTTDLGEALEQQTATSEVLRVISSSPSDLQPVFNAMLENATRLCEAKFGVLFRFHGNAFHLAAQVGTTPEYAEFLERRGPFQPRAGSQLDRVMRTKRVSSTVDRTAEPVPGPAPTLGGARSTVYVPMLKDDGLVGIIVIYRQEVRPFTDKQIALVQNFVAQAVIAIENARLLSELRQSLEQQTATADVLRVISSSPGELQPVFEAMLQNAVQICDAKFGNLGLLEGDGFRFVAQHRAPPNYRDARQREPLVRANTRTNLDGVIKTKQVVHVADVAAEEPHSGIATLAGARTLLNVPMLKDDELVGIIAIYRQEVRPFTGKQIDVLQNFAAQAVIAIENARLLNELRESLDRQTATADILRVIASTPEDSKHALDTIAETASRMFDTANVNFRRLEGNVLRMVSAAGPSVTKLREVVPDASLEPTEPAVRCVLENRQIAIEDRQAALPNERGEIGRALHDLALRGLPIRSQAFTPLLRESKAIGVMIVSRGEVQPFQEHELELMKGFADQAVIAIENARLLNELRQSLEQQTATADVLRIISSSPGELGPVFQAMLRNATRLCEANFGNLFLREGNGFRTVAIHSSPSPYTEWYERHPIVEPTKEYPHSTLARLIETKKILHIADLRLDRGYLEGYPPIVALVDGAGARSDLLVPMIKDDQLIGAIVIYRTEVRQFTEKQIELVQNFAAQAVIAIENARLLNDLNKLNQQLEQRVSDQVGEIERMGRLRRFLPPQVADLIVASGTEKQLESHRREITALFCDLRGFTGFSESSDPEDVIALLRDYHAAIGQIIIKYSGTLERYAGDGVMVVFNDPVPVENPALQAVLMALEMRNAIGALTETWHRWGHDIGFGIGIAHGFATLGTIGFEGRVDYAAIGTVSNVASRLCDEAKPGQILISPRVLTKVENAVTVEPVGEFTLKGIRRPMTAYNVLAASPSNPN